MSPDVTVDTYDEYIMRGKMFDGRPIFCAEGFDIKEARMTLIASERDASHAEIKIRHELRQFLDSEYPEHVEIDSRFIENDWDIIERGKGLPMQHLRKLTASVLVAVH